jgi:hypothetical protein
MVMRSRAGSNSKALVTFPCETLTPFGLPVLPKIVVSVHWDFDVDEKLPDV